MSRDLARVQPLPRPDKIGGTVGTMTKAMRAHCSREFKEEGVRQYPGRFATSEQSTLQQKTRMPWSGCAINFTGSSQ
jgi:hypothetical protein